MMAEAAPNPQPSTETSEKQTETIRANTVRTLESKQRFIATRQTLNQEKSNLKMVLVFKEISIKVLSEHKLT